MNVLIVGILFFAFFLRLPFLSDSFWMDEAAQAIESMRPFQEQLQIAADFQPPLFHYWVHFFTLLSHQEWWLRLATILPAMGSIFLVLILDKYKKNKSNWGLTLYAGLLISFSAFHIFFSQELRQYMMATWWGTLSWFVLLRWDKNISRKQQLLLGLINVAGLYSMYVYLFHWFAQGLYILIHQHKQRKAYIFSSFFGIALFLPWIPGFLEQLRIGTTLQRSLPGWAEVVSSPQWKALPLVLLKFLGGGKEISFSPFDALYFGVPVVILGVLVFKFYKKVPTYLWYWSAVSVLLAWVVSFIVPVVSPKRVLFALPAMFLIISHLIYSLKNLRLRNTVLGLFLLMQALGLIFYWTTPSMQREDWRSMIAGFHQNYSTADTVVVFGFTAPFAPWRFYEPQYELQFHAIAFPQMPLTDQDIQEQLKDVTKFKRVLVLDYLRDLTDPQRKIEKYLEAHGFEGIDSLETKNMGFVRVYERKTFLSLENFAIQQGNKVQ